MIENWWQLCLVIITVTICIFITALAVGMVFEAKKEKKDG